MFLQILLASSLAVYIAGIFCAIPFVITAEVRKSESTLMLFVLPLFSWFFVGFMLKDILDQIELIRNS